ncbi:MAG: chromosome segregation protein SMC [bacterium]|nr:chromosome segregation protein SMC [bacterium]
MTRVTKIVVEGFKSFAKRTELNFGPDFNVVLGPNGGGKSNVMDSLCFVLGRMSSKELRTEKLSHLIYNGGKTKKPASKAEVSIFFDNAEKTFPTEAPVIKITRIVKPTGQSVYKINDEKRTRQQILDLLAYARIDPNGHNIVLQGDIVKFVEMSPEQKRLLVEEISGIGIYEEKKNKALKELEKVETKLKEAEILLTERKTHLKELKKDRDQAQKYKEMSDKVKQNKATYINLQMKSKEAKKKVLEKDIAENKAQIDKMQSDISKLKAQVGERKEAIKKISEDIEAKGEIEQIKLNKSIEGTRVDIATSKNRLLMCDQELEKIITRREQLKEDISETEEKIKELEESKKTLDENKKKKLEEKATIEKSIKKFKDDNQFSDVVEIESEVEKLDKETEQKQVEAQKLAEQKQNLLREKDKIDFQINSIDESINKVLEVEKEKAKEITDLKNNRAEFKKLVLELNKLLNDDSANAVRLKETRLKLDKKRDELTKLETRDLAIKERTISNVAVKRILEQKNKIKGIYGTISELGTVKSKYSIPLEVAAGGRMNSIVVQDDEVAAKCIKYLKTNRMGTATFLPLNKLREKDVQDKSTGKIKGVHDLAINLVSFDPKFKKAFSYVFSSTFVVDNIDVARRVGIGKARMVTLDGDLADISGAMHGGHRQRKLGLGFKEEEVSDNLAELEKQVSDLEGLKSALQSQKAENEEAIAQLKQKKADLEGEIIKAEKSLHLGSGEIDASKNEKTELEKKNKELDTELRNAQQKSTECNLALAELKTQRQQLRDKIGELRNPALLAELNTFEQKRQELNDELLKIENNIKNADVQINDVFGKELEKVQQIFKQLDKEEDSFTKEKDALQKKTENNSKSLKKMEADAAKFHAKYKELFEKKGKIGEEIQKAEEKIIRKDEQINTIEVKINNVSLKNAEIAAELSGLQQEFEQYTDVKLLREASEDQLRSEISRYERMVVSMGNVNLKALEIYDDVEKQYRSLLDKKETLSKEKEDVLLMMNEVEGKKKDLFMKTFVSINENFKRTFQMLSTKGDAYLMLENPESPFEGGVRIRVKITGSKFLDIRSLSGGEKTMTALAFIFAIQEYEPASFYVFDEVDAALDKRNSEKLAHLIRKYSDKAQYLIISHNDSLISEATTLFGVSMDEHNTSKVVSLKI